MTDSVDQTNDLDCDGVPFDPSTADLIDAGRWWFGMTEKERVVAHKAALAIPTEQLAAAMALPEIKALVAAADKVDDEYCAQEYGPTMHTIEGLRAALAPFGKATE